MFKSNLGALSTLKHSTLNLIIAISFAACNKNENSSNNELKKCKVANFDLKTPRELKLNHQSIALGVQISSDELENYNVQINMACLQNSKSQLLGFKSSLNTNKYFSRRHFAMKMNSFEKEKFLKTQGNCVTHIEGEMMLQTRGLGDPKELEQEHLDFIGVYDAQNYLSAANIVLSKKVKIAIIDSGVDYRHEDLKNQMWHNAGENGLDALGKDKRTNHIDDDKNGYIDDDMGYDFASNSSDPGPKGFTHASSHGTHVAGLAAAASDNGFGGRGVLGSNAEIMALNVFGASQGASTVDINNAIIYAADQGADVINMSLGGSGYSQSTEEAIIYAIDRGVTIIVAAGNEEQKISLSKNSWSFDTPASFGGMYKGIIAVASLDSADGNLSDFSNYSSDAVEIGAPGSESSSSRKGLLSTLPGNKYGRSEGTSMASPVVAGAALYLKAIYKNSGVQISPDELETVILDHSLKNNLLISKIKNGKTLDLSEIVKYSISQLPIQPNIPVLVPEDPTIPITPIDPVVTPVDPPVDAGSGELPGDGGTVKPQEPNNPVGGSDQKIEIDC